MRLYSRQRQAFDSSRYEYFAREGSGIVALGFEDTNKVPVKIFDSNKINLGAFISLAPKNTEDKRFKLQFLNYTNDKRNPFTSSSTFTDGYTCSQVDF